MSDSLRIPLCRRRSSFVIGEAWVDSDLAQWVTPWTWFGFGCSLPTVDEAKQRPPHLWLGLECSLGSGRMGNKTRFSRLDLHRYVVILRLQAEGVFRLGSSGDNPLTPDQPLLLSRLVSTLPRILFRSPDTRNCCWSNLVVPLSVRLLRPRLG